MSKYKKDWTKELIVLGVIVVLGLGVYSAANSLKLEVNVNVNFPDDKLEVALGSGVEFRNVASSSGMTINTISALIVASSSRTFLEIVNDGDNTVYLQFGDIVALAGQGSRINANGGVYTIDDTNLFLGAIRGITTTGSSNITFTEQF